MDGRKEGNTESRPDVKVGHEDERHPTVAHADGADEARPLDKAGNHAYDHCDQEENGCDSRD
jgi:hypothetical protein